MRGSFVAAAAIAALAVGGAGQAETLRDALVQTYNGNPTIAAQRAQLRTLDAGVAVARAAARPQLFGTAGVNQDVLTTRRGFNNGRSFSAGVDVSYPLFNGGRVR